MALESTTSVDQAPAGSASSEQTPTVRPLEAVTEEDSDSEEDGKKPPVYREKSWTWKKKRPTAVDDQNVASSSKKAETIEMDEKTKKEEEKRDEEQQKSVTWSGLAVNKIIDPEVVTDDNKSFQSENSERDQNDYNISASAVRRDLKRRRNKKILQEAQKFRESFYWFAHNHTRIGLRHFVMLFVIASYSLLGATIFYNLESKYELHRFAMLNEKVTDVATAVLLLNANNTLPSLHEMEELVKQSYIAMLQVEDLYDGSTFYKVEDPKHNFKWTFGSSFFFSANLFTTVGYGSITCDTTAGQMLTIIYGLIGIPLTLVVLRDFGQFALVHLTKLYARGLVWVRKSRGLPTFDGENIRLPLKFCLSIHFGYLIFATIVVYNYDALWGPEGSGIDFFHAFYFSFISLSTIGLGDVMPNNATFSPLIAILFFFGMPIAKVINRVTYVTIENGVFGTLAVLENNLDFYWLSKAKATDLGLPPTPTDESGEQGVSSACPHQGWEFFVFCFFVFCFFWYF